MQALLRDIDNEWVRIRFIDDEATEREIPRSQFHRVSIKQGDRVLLTSVLTFDAAPDPATLNAEFCAARRRRTLRARPKTRYLSLTC